MRFPQNLYQHYHAHLYYDSSSVEVAQHIYQKLQSMSEYRLGRFHRKLVGPHPQWSFQIAFTRSQFDEIITWLERHRQDLSVLVHGDTGNFFLDHTEHAYWLGEEHKLNLRMA
ncbi:DOPA 4,5-dioxygenase [Vibrio xiamenensis]|uniref:DOPA 4,5-dioxygenase n=1 Tax=Vibrio xiamenensis TaxID=861298 RepID=A0A1G7ZQX0_9VIBR|nr:DOPA 4,5-dioxygenase family protein [Vibrio xiamenensis]SDH11059.1 DOPA 4,5-dioxygenase [Vibrio xiamenensis]